jgi:hypothetical protein
MITYGSIFCGPWPSLPPSVLPPRRSKSDTICKARPGWMLEIQRSLALPVSKSSLTILQFMVRYQPQFGVEARTHGQVLVLE